MNPDASPAARRTRRRRLAPASLLLAALLGLAACSSLLPGSNPPANLYRLTPKSTFGPELPTVDWQLVLSPPYAPGAIDTVRIALAPTPTRIEYYADASWTDRMPLMVQALLLESFENSRKIVSVGRRAIGLRSDYELRTDIREFQAEYYAHPGQPETCSGVPACVDIAINAKLVYSPTRTIVATRSFTAFTAVPVDSLDQAVDAYDLALGHVLKEMVGWTLLEGARDWAEREGQRPRSFD